MEKQVVMEKEFEKEFITYELALRMKALDYDEPCMASRDMGNNHGLIQVPTWQSAFRWFREKYSTHVEIHETTDWEEDNESWSFVIFKYRLGDNDGMISSTIDYDTYEDAELDCLKKLIEIVENEKML
jgi:hypothetical protein